MFGIPASYWLTNIHFTLGIISFFAFFAAAALYVDSYFSVRRSSLLLLRAAGFFLLAVWAGCNGALGASGVIIASQLSFLLFGALSVTALSFFLEFLPGRPTQKKTRARAMQAWLPLSLASMVAWLNPLLGFVVAARIWYQATVKLERSRKLLALAIFFLALSWLITAITLTPSGQGGALSVLAEPFGVFWILTRALEALGSAFLLLWAWRFLRFRLFPQLYLTVVAAVLIAFVAATVSLTVALITNAQQQTLRILATNVRVFAYTLEELEQKMALAANSISNRQNLVTIVAENNTAAIASALGNPINDFGVSAVTVLNAGGEVMYTLGGNLRPGDSLSDDPVTLRAFTGESIGSAYVESGPEFPLVSVRAGAPLVKDGKAIGAVIVDFPADTAFLDRVKELTGLEIVLFSDTQLAATTLRDTAGRPRHGTGDAALAQRVIEAEKGFQGAALLGHEPFLIAGLALSDINEKRVGALVVGVSEVELLRSLDEATQRTLIGSVLLMVLSLLPLYGVARVITRYQSA